MARKREPSDPFPPDRLRVAYHEAAHALVAQQLGRPVESVSLIPGGGGFVVEQPFAPNGTPAEIEKGLTVLFAGRAAEKFAPLVSPEEQPPDDPYFTHGENEAAFAAKAINFGESPSDEDMVAHYEARIGAEAAQRARALAEELVGREHALGRLEALASELLRHRHLTNAEITAALNGGNGHVPV